MKSVLTCSVCHEGSTRVSSSSAPPFPLCVTAKHNRALHILVTSHVDEYAEALKTRRREKNRSRDALFVTEMRKLPQPILGLKCGTTEMIEMRDRGAPALRVPDPYGVNRSILRAKKLNFEVLDIKPYFPQTLAELDFSAFHVVRSILSIPFFSDLFYHNFITLSCRPEDARSR